MEKKPLELKSQSREDRIANLVKRGFVSEKLVDMSGTDTDEQKKVDNDALYTRTDGLKKAGRQFDLVVSDDGKRELFVMPEAGTIQE